MKTPFFVSDSFTIEAVQNAAWHYPGPFHMEHVWGPGEPVQAEFCVGEFGFILFRDGAAEGVNGDVYIGLYDITTQQAVPDTRLKALTLAEPTPNAPMGEVVLMNNTARIGLVSSAGGRYLKSPIRLGGVTTPATGGPFQLGAHMRFFMAGDNIGKPLTYQYFMQGFAVPVAEPPTPSLILTLPDGTQYAVPATLLP